MPGPLRVVDEALGASGFKPLGPVSIEVDPSDAAADLAVALAIMLLHPACEAIRRAGLIAWGELGTDGSLDPQRGLTNDLPAGPYAGQIWHPDDRLPRPDEDAVITVTRVATLREALQAFEFFAVMEDRVSDLEEIVLRRAARPLPR